MRESRETAQREDLVAGRNGVLELLKSGNPVEIIYIQEELGGIILEISKIAKDKGIKLEETDRKTLDNLAPGVPHQGTVAVLGKSRYCTMDDIFDAAGDSPPFIILADGIEDPYNLGAIIRTAESAGAHGLIIPKRRSAGLTYVVSKASAGAVEHLPVVRVTNLVRTMEELKEKGIWFYAADMGGTMWCQQDFSGGVGLVIGAEGSGVSRLVKERSDFTVSLPMEGKIQSLNASVASGIIMYEIARQRLGLNFK